MARLARLTLPGHVHHVIQRGNNRDPIFSDAADRIEMLRLMELAVREQRVALHAYVLMDNHVHLLLTPESSQALPRMMQALGRAYVHYFNRRHGRTGTLWEGRYRSTLIQAEHHLLGTMAYIDLKPVRAGLVAAPAEFAWSSHAHYAGLRVERMVTPHTLLWSLGNTPFAREASYCERVANGVSDAEERALTDATLGGWALGDDAFRRGLLAQGGRRAEKRTPGRPRKPGHALDANVSPINTKAE